MNKTYGAIVHAELFDAALDITGPEEYLCRDEEATLDREMAFS